LVIVYQLPPVNERLGWRVASLQARVRRMINPPEEVVFVPGGQVAPGGVETSVSATLTALPVDPATPPPPEVAVTSAAPTAPEPTSTNPPSPTPTPQPTPIPPSASLPGISFEYQQFNNCGPANLSMALSYWGWVGTQNQTRAFLRPNREVDDKNVNPSEMVAFVEGFTGLRAIARVGGDVETLRRLLAAGFPVVIEEGHDPADDWWMGHYLLINAYDDAARRFTTQDSLLGPDLPRDYGELEAEFWRDFNYTYVVIFPAERQEELFAILGAQADEATSYQRAADMARAEIATLQGRDLFFAWFNLGSSLVGLGDYAGAAQAYDQAFLLYQGLSEELRPYRLMWYQHGPYPAYYYTGRYQDVINLANTTFAWVGQPVLEESYYWRGMAYDALGERERAIAELKKAAGLNPNFTIAYEQLERLGVQLP
jgi:tetratricopeptide (TPR) repeat protein